MNAKVIKCNMKVLEKYQENKWNLPRKVPRILTGKVWGKDWYCTKKVCFRNQDKTIEMIKKVLEKWEVSVFFLFFST